MYSKNKARSIRPKQRWGGGTKFKKGFGAYRRDH